MNKLIRALALAGLCLASSLSQAVPITHNFSATGFAGGGTLNGSFTGDDTGGYQRGDRGLLGPDLL